MAARALADSTLALLDRLSGLAMAVAMALLGVMTGLVVLQVACRNFLALGLPWADELARFGGIALTYLAVPYLLGRGKHIAVDLLVERLGGLGRQAALAASDLLVAGFCGLTAWGFLRFLDRAAAFSTPALGLPNLVFYLPAFIGILLLGLVALARAVCRLAGGQGLDGDAAEGARGAPADPT